MDRMNSSTKKVKSTLLGMMGAALLGISLAPSAYAADPDRKDNGVAEVSNTASAPSMALQQAVSPTALGSSQVSSHMPYAYTSAAALSLQATGKITTKKIAQATSAYQAVLLLPVISGLKDSAYQAELNSRIEKAALKELETLKKQASTDLASSKKDGYEFHPYQIKVQYSAGWTGINTAAPILSLKLNTYTYTGGAHGISRIDTYTMKNEEKAVTVTLKSLFGDSYRSILDAEIKKGIAKNPESYFPGPFPGVKQNQPFYLKNGSVQIVFQPYDIAPYSSGTPTFAVKMPAAVSPAAPAAAQAKAKTIDNEEDTYSADVDIPLLSGLLDTGYEQEWNAKQEAAATKKLETMKKSAADRKRENPSGFSPSELTQTFQLTSDGSPADKGIVSLKITTSIYEGGAGGTTTIETFNIRNAATAVPVSLEALFGDHYESQVGAAIQASISKDKNNYFQGNDGFRGVNADSVFYKKGSDVYVVFQQGEIAPRANGNPEFKLPLSAGETSGTETAPLQVKIGGKELSGIKAATNKDGVAIIPIRAAAEALGYKLKWNDRLSMLELSKGSQWTSVTIGSDSYSYNKMTPVALGAAPAYDGQGRMTVPLAFFTEILHAKASYEEGSVTLENSN